MFWKSLEFPYKCEILILMTCIFVGCTYCFISSVLSQHEFILIFNRRRGESESWDSTVQPGMRNAVVAAMLCAQDHIDIRKVTIGFDIYLFQFVL
jgi:hypothetical protein